MPAAAAAPLCITNAAVVHRHFCCRRHRHYHSPARSLAHARVNCLVVVVVAAIICCRCCRCLLLGERRHAARARARPPGSKAVAALSTRRMSNRPIERRSYSCHRQQRDRDVSNSVKTSFRMYAQLSSGNKTKKRIFDRRVVRPNRSRRAAIDSPRLTKVGARLPP